MPTAQNLIKNSVVCDITLPWLPGTENQPGTLERFAASGFDFVSLTIAYDPSNLHKTILFIAELRRQFDKNADKFAFVRSVADIRKAQSEGKLAIGFNSQGSEVLEGHIEMVRLFNDLGIRQMLLAYNWRNRAGDGCHESDNGGLSRYGHELVSEMNRVGMLVDLTHTNYRTSMDAIEASHAPVIFSHSGCRAIKDHERNIRDDQIKACVATGGMIGLPGIGFFLANNDASPARLVDHIDHIFELVGPGHAGLGLDYVYYMDSMIATFQAHPELFPRGYPDPPWFAMPPEDLEGVVDELIKRGYAEGDILGILGENFLRVASQVWDENPIL